MRTVDAVDTHVHGPVALITAVLPGMRAQRSGAIVNISSIGARIYPPGSGYYCAVEACRARGRRRSCRSSVPTRSRRWLDPRRPDRRAGEVAGRLHRDGRRRGPSPRPGPGEGPGRNAPAGTEREGRCSTRAYPHIGSSPLAPWSGDARTRSTHHAASGHPAYPFV
ncbi:MAG: SDR family NAD(P)-dependent oxidoreductase [Pseudonocardia sp.]|uniref:SDR family NAD(P)-dependent oxidoreductase n=1 Tax=unclassified Pseudonocardia TaxID=2619320 RepID=UPI001ACEAFBE|nr:MULTISPECIES: SDR family NAD(P)-dependent oxidoreductase [unclassified Pseudonocardia]MBN9108207.1 SDR family NAD(P)-dependent oxidoreductase [Pseudonocardia sp.]